MLREMISIGQWYLREDMQERFQVLDHDERSGTVRIQMFDGTLDEFDEDAWPAMSPQAVGPPEDWTGPLDNVAIEEPEDLAGETAAASEDDFIDHREPWESLLREADDEVHDPEELDEDQWLSMLAARDRSRNRAPPRSRA